MSHIATLTQAEIGAPCRHYGRAHTIAAFYALPMSLRIKTLREEKGWTQADLAERARMSRSQLAMIENETRPANTLRLNAIAAALGVEAQDLFDSPESRLIGLVRGLCAEDRDVLVRMAEALAANAAQKQER